MTEERKITIEDVPAEDEPEVKVEVNVEKADDEPAEGDKE